MMGHLDHPIRVCEDMLYNICTNDIFRGNLPIVNPRIYIDLITASRPLKGLLAATSRVA